MKLIDALKYLRQSILDDTGGDNLDWTEVTEEDETSRLLRWSNEELVSFIEQAQKEAVRNSQLIRDESYVIKYSADINTYTLPSEILVVYYVYDNTNRKQLKSVDYRFVNDNNHKGIPSSYSLNSQNNILKLFPIPQQDGELLLVVDRLPIKKLSFSKPNDELELKDDFVKPALWYAAFLAYNKDEPNTFDPNRAEYFRNLFNSYFGSNSAYSFTRRLRKSRRTTSYGGL